MGEEKQQLRRNKREADFNSQTEHKRRRKQEVTGTISPYFLPSTPTSRRDGHPKSDVDGKSSNEDEDIPTTSRDKEEMTPQIRKIAGSNLTSFRKQTLTLLCQVPRGRYSTYQAMSDYISATSHKTCARAVGNAMRNNPFAPAVPCHRILAADGSLGGFCGYWGEDGKFASRKHQLLHEEGVRFDSKGKVKGPPFRDFKS